jgi:hypothetical protein
MPQTSLREEDQRTCPQDFVEGCPGMAGRSRKKLETKPI